MGVHELKRFLIFHHRSRYSNSIMIIWYMRNTPTPRYLNAHYPGAASRHCDRKCFITSFAFGRRVCRCRPLFNRSSGGRLSNKAVFLTRFASTVFSAYVYCFLRNNNIMYNDRATAVTRVQSKRVILYYRKLTDIDAHETFFVRLLVVWKKKKKRRSRYFDTIL